MTIKYKGIKVIIKYCIYKNFNWYAIKYRNVVILLFNRSYKHKSKVLHKTLKYNMGGKNHICHPYATLI
jgi:hypothetical protein